MKRVVITGATGVIGRALIHTCIEAGYEVLAVIHKSSTRSSELKQLIHCRILYLDLNEYDHGYEAMEEQGLETDDYELFFHLAWAATFGRDRDDLQLQLENVSFTLHAAEFAKALGCRTFVGIGSQAEYGRVEGVLSATTPAFPETGYGMAKLCAGEMTRLRCEQLGIRSVWCRVLSVYGPYDRDQTLISTAVAAMLKGEETSFTRCDQMWDYIYADDAAMAILLAGQSGENGRVYVIGSGEAYPLRQYIEQIAAVTGYKKEIGFGRRPYNDRQVMHLQADPASLRSLGFQAMTSFEDGIRKTVEWHKRKMGRS